ncbi:16S rRNA (Guanine(966)-N(2))-methyltransferase RsmD OS=Castellaniella defragrans OX=75697 GN=HNR28_002611 PE=4 SV=1 [Castellaniella denitrificans]
MKNTRSAGRIVGGAYRRTPISVPEGDHLRPTPDRVRADPVQLAGAFLGRIVRRPTGARTSFAGTGALGFEAASRGVETVQLVEQAPAALAGLRAVQARLKAPAIRIHAGEACAFLRAQQAPSYDLVMLDPPFGAGWLQRLPPLLDRAVLPGGLLYLESESPFGALPPDWELLRQGRAGQVHYGLIQFAATQKNMNNDCSETL